ncbi:MAG: radical SAM protein [Bacteroidales bacterium]
MATFLFDNIVFGPVKSRRLGNSLGINLLPLNKKVCNFNCVYCECGWTFSGTEKLPAAEYIIQSMENKFRELSEGHVPVDVITFAGNGEPTMHPQFSRIISEVLKLRERYFPGAKIAVLTNATLLHKESVRMALQKIDMALLKLDSAFEKSVRTINQPQGHFNFPTYLENIRNFPGKKIIQTMFIRYEKDGKIVDNTSEIEIAAWLDELDKIRPDLVMIYSIARDTPDKAVRQIGLEKLKAIARQVEARGYKSEVS